MKVGAQRFSQLVAAAAASFLGFAAHGSTPTVDRTLLPYASTSNSARLPDGRTIHLVCMGRGSPTVILASGGSSWSLDWNLVQPAVAKRTRVCAWDRAGLGLSSPSPKPQSVDNTTTDLETALRARGIVGPYVMVGHSTGGFDSMLMADRHPKEVRGMVLVDPTPPRGLPTSPRPTPAIDAIMSGDPPPVAVLRQCAAGLRSGTIRPGGNDPNGCLRPPPSPSNYPPELSAALSKDVAHTAPELVAEAMDNIAFYMSAQLLAEDAKIAENSRRNYGAMPLIVLSAGDAGESPLNPPAINAELPGLLANKQSAHDQLSRLSTRGVHRVVSGSAHAIQQDKPQAVIDAILEVVDEVRMSPRASGTR